MVQELIKILITKLKKIIFKEDLISIYITSKGWGRGNVFSTVHSKGWGKREGFHGQTITIYPDHKQHK